MSDAPAARPRIVCLCGSLRASDEIAAERVRLTLEMVVVLSPELVEAPGQDLADALGELHLRRIDLADEVRVVNPGGYVGEATRREIAYAARSGKRVTYVHDVAVGPLTTTSRPADATPPPPGAERA